MTALALLPHEEENIRLELYLRFINEWDLHVSYNFLLF